MNYLKVFKKYFDLKAYDLHYLFPKTLEFKLEKPMFQESMFNTESMFESRLFVEDFLPILSVIAFGYIVSCLAFLFSN